MYTTRTPRKARIDPDDSTVRRRHRQHCRSQDSRWADDLRKSYKRTESDFRSPLLAFKSLGRRRSTSAATTTRTFAFEHDEADGWDVLPPRDVSRPGMHDQASGNEITCTRHPPAPTRPRSGCGCHDRGLRKDFRAQRLWRLPSTGMRVNALMAANGGAIKGNNGNQTPARWSGEMPRPGLRGRDRAYDFDANGDTNRDRVHLPGQVGFRPYPVHRRLRFQDGEDRMLRLDHPVRLR